MAKKQLLGLLLLCLTILGADFWLKSYTHQYITPMKWAFSSYPYGGVPVFQNVLGVSFSLNYVSNKGAAWGVFSAFQNYLLYFRLAVIGGLLYYLVSRKLSTSSRFAFALILAGAFGNVIDFFLYGHVVDMFLFSFGGHLFPVFNIADSAIFCGVVLLLFLKIHEKKCKNSR